MLFPGMSDIKALSLNPGVQAPRIFNDEQLVIIGTTRVDIYETLDNGWTIPYGVSIGMFGNYLIGYNHTILGNQSFFSINGSEPENYANQMIYTRRSWSMMRFHGVLTGVQGEEFTFALPNWNGDLYDKTYIADRRFFTIDNSDQRSQIPNYFVAITDNGYFSIDFIEPPIGFYSITEQGRVRVVEFVAR
jgi:hypothetical protein